VLRRLCPQCHHPIKGLRAHAYRCSFCQRGDYRKDVVSVLGSSSALLRASQWILHLVGVEGEEVGTTSGGGIHTPERLDGLSAGQIFELLERMTRAFTLSYSWGELREMCELWGLLTPKDREVLQQQNESQKLLIVIFFLGLFQDWPRQFEWWLEEVFDAARIHGREKELMDGYQERMRQELFRDPYKGIEAQYRSYAVEWIKTKGDGYGLGMNGCFDTMVERMKRYGLGWSLTHDVIGWGIIAPGRKAWKWEDLSVVSHLKCRYSHRGWRESLKYCRVAEEEQAKNRDERKGQKKEPCEGLWKKLTYQVYLKRAQKARERLIFL
jgi:hypothetical protein